MYILSIFHLFNLNNHNLRMIYVGTRHLRHLLHAVEPYLEADLRGLQRAG